MRKLPEGWQVKRLADVLQKTETINPRNNPEDEFEYIDVSSVSRNTFSIEKTTRLKGKEAPSRARRQVKTGDVLYATIRPTLQRIATVPDNLDGEVCSTGYFILRPKKKNEINNRFLYYYLFTKTFMTEMEIRQRGASYPAVNDGDVRGQCLPLPPLPEQKRIVAILDEVFAGITRAVANAEKNLANARELFDNYLNNVFTQKGEGWVEKSIEECFTIKSGDFLPKKKMNLSGSHDVYGGNGLTGKHDKFNLSGLNIVIGRVGAKCGNVRTVKKDIWLTDNAFYISELLTEFDIDFLSLALSRADLGGTANQTAQPVISYKTIKPVVLFFPSSIDKQQAVVNRSNRLQKQTQYLETIYQQKLTALVELKQSILQKAFAGELTADMAVQEVSA